MPAKTNRFVLVKFVPPVAEWQRLRTFRVSNGTTDAAGDMRQANVFMEHIAKSHRQMTARATEQKFSMEKVAELIRVHVSTVSRLMDSGKLGYYQIGRRRIVGASHLEQYLSLAERQAKIRSIR